MSKQIKWGFLVVMGAAFLWSLDGLLRRELYVLPPITIVFLEHVIGFILLAPFLFRYRKEIQKIDRPTWLIIGVIALLSGVLGTLFYTTALGKISYIPFSVVVLVQKLQPIFAIFVAAILLKERITKSFLAWAALALLAAYVVTFPDLTVSWQKNSGEIIAALFAFLAAVAWGTSTAFSRYGLLRVSYPLMVGLRFAATIVFAIPFLWALGGTSAVMTMTGTQWQMLLAIALTTGMVAMVIYYRGLSWVPARVSTIAELFWPISALFLDYFYFDGRLSWTQWVGVVMLLGAILRIGFREIPESSGSTDF